MCIYTNRSIQTHTHTSVLCIEVEITGFIQNSFYKFGYMKFVTIDLSPKKTDDQKAHEEMLNITNY